jgi:hypothetical protein
MTSLLFAAAVRKKRALDMDEFPKNAQGREGSGPAKLSRPAEPVEEAKPESDGEEDSEDDSSDDEALGGLCLDKEDRFCPCIDVDCLCAL